MDKKNRSPEEELVNKIKSDANQKIKSKKEGKEIMFGLGLFGIVGWAITIPTLIGVAIGVYFDEKFQVNFSWTLTLLFVGLVIGCLNAWHWIKEKSEDE